MARRRESLFDTLLVLPWWIATAMGVLGYVAIVYLPQFLANHRFAAAVLGLRPFASVWLALCFGAAVISALRAFLISRKFDRQHGIDDIRALSWREFELFTGEAFRRKGYSVVENGGDGPDGRIDLTLRKDGQKIVVQCKQWKAWTVGVKPVRELAGVIAASDAAGGIFVTSGRYTEEARRFARKISIELIDGDALVELIQSARGSHPHLEPTISGISADVPDCPICGSDMVSRTAKRGANAGGRFWGCSRYPQCRGIRQVETAGL